jgi:hypothetical protein
VYSCFGAASTSRVLAASTISPSSITSTRSHTDATTAGNPLIVVCLEVARSVVLEQIEDRLSHASDRPALMRTWLAHHGEVLQPIRDSDGDLASRLARRALYDNYAEYVPKSQRALLEPLLDEVDIH